MRNVFISTNATGPVNALDPDTSLILVKDVLLSSPGTGILATGDATDRTIVVNGDIVADQAGIVFGAGTVKDLDGTVIISGTGTLKAGRAGISAIADAMEIINRGSVDAKLTGVFISGTKAKVTNEGLVESTSSNAVDIDGASAMVVNNGRFAGKTDSVTLSGAQSVMTNNGSIGSSTANGIVVNGADSTVTNNGSIGATGHGIFATGATETITNNGKIGSGGSAIIAKGREAIVTNSGTLNAGGQGIALYGDEGIVTNRKSIEVGGSALLISADDATVNNLGTVKGAIGFDVRGRDVKGANSGLVESWKGSAVDTTFAKDASFNNSGIIAAASGLAFKGGASHDTLVNSGTIKGDVSLGAGNDYFDGRSGIVMGHVAGGKGNDTYTVSNTKILILEDKAGGRDMVNATVSYALKANFEDLTLIGNKAIDATGNAAINQLHGNAASNRIDGQAGNDVIWGHGGNDILTGGAGRDQFVFATGDGRDVITDFSARGSNSDSLNLREFDAITDFRDLMANHAKQIGSDVLIDSLTGDTILLKNVKIADLDTGHFLF